MSSYILRQKQTGMARDDIAREEYLAKEKLKKEVKEKYKY